MTHKRTIPLLTSIPSYPTYQVILSVRNTRHWTVSKSVHCWTSLTDFLLQLHAHEWNQIGVSTVDKQGNVAVGQVIMAQRRDGSLFQHQRTLFHLHRIHVHTNPEVHQLIQIHEKLAFMRDTIPQLEALLQALPKHATEHNNVKLRLAHKDLHFCRHSLRYFVE